MAGQCYFLGVSIRRPLDAALAGVETRLVHVSPVSLDTCGRQLALMAPPWPHLGGLNDCDTSAVCDCSAGVVYSCSLHPNGNRKVVLDSKAQSLPHERRSGCGSGPDKRVASPNIEGLTSGSRLPYRTNLFLGVLCNNGLNVLPALGGNSCRHEVFLYGSFDTSNVAGSRCRHITW